MQSVRIQPAIGGKLFIDVVCDCGINGLTNKETGESTFKHPIVLGDEARVGLVCDICQSEYLVIVQGNHFHVKNNPTPDEGPVLFYEGTRYFLSNFASFRVNWRGIDWMTSEHAYQAAKFWGKDIVETIRLAPSAHEARQIAKHFAEHIDLDFYENQLSIMEEIQRAKLAQHPYIQRKLRETDTREIIENSPRDSFWGRGRDWKGKNNLGKIWMKLRAELPE